jgi:competence protein ComEC
MYDRDKIEYLLKNYSKVMLFSIVFLITFVIFSYLSYVFDKRLLEVYFLDVGQGDSELIISPKKNILLIDTGQNEKVVGKIEKILNIKKIDAIILTHQDLDHAGGFDSISSAFHVKSLFVSKNYTEKLDFANKNTVSQGDALEMGGIKLETISPRNTDIGSTNHTSIVSVLKYGNYRFIFMADADKETERKLVAQSYFEDGDQYIDILKLGHHGSDTSSAESFLKKIKPEYCIFSVGKANSYGLPSKSVVDLSEKYCKSIYRTDNDGNIGMYTDGRVLKIKKSL